MVLELGCGVGAPALALARCGAKVVATDISEAALALTTENTNGTNGTVVTRLLDWDDDDALREVLAEGPFFAVVGAALKFEDWPVGRLDAVLNVLDPTVVVLAHAWADGAPRGKAAALRSFLLVQSLAASVLVMGVMLSLACCPIGFMLADNEMDAKLAVMRAVGAKCDIRDEGELRRMVMGESEQRIEAPRKIRELLIDMDLAHTLAPVQLFEYGSFSGDAMLASQVASCVWNMISFQFSPESTTKMARQALPGSSKW